MIKEENGYYIWEKGQDLVLSKFFSTHEFDCQCHNTDCKTQKISKALITKLDHVRVDIGRPLTITSGFRCAKHQKEIADSGQSTVVAKLSTHELGDAADITPADHVMTGFEAICSKYFDSIGLAASFLHVDLRIGRRRWKY